MEKLHVQLMAVPARRVAADNRRHFWWAIGGTLVVLVSPLLLLCLLPVGVWPAVGALACALLCAALCGFAGVVRGVVVPPSLDDDAIEEQIRTRAKEKLRVGVRKVGRAVAATTYEEIKGSHVTISGQHARNKKMERWHIVIIRHTTPGNEVGVFVIDGFSPKSLQIERPIAGKCRARGLSSQIGRLRGPRTCTVV